MYLSVHEIKFRRFFQFGDAMKTLISPPFSTHVIQSNVKELFTITKAFTLLHSFILKSCLSGTNEKRIERGEQYMK